MRFQARFPVTALCTFLITATDAVAAPPWQKHLPPIGNRPSEQAPWLRTLVHMHSVHSHDACDKRPEKNGSPNERCLEDFRRALCEEHVDVVFLTEHRDALALRHFAEAIPIRERDRLLIEDGSVVGTEHTCPDGHRVTTFTGSENSLMAVGLTRHPDPLPGMDLEATYNSRTPEAAQKFREAGALVAINHAEDAENSLELLRSIRPELIEAYNLHANLVQDIEPKRRYGKALKTVLEALSFITNPLLESDLIFHAFFKENPDALQKWGQLATEMDVTGVAGTDAHQNAMPFKMWDGDRVDSYRRSVRWFSNWLKAPESPSRPVALEALRRGRSMVVFETLGSPLGFEFTAESARGSAAMGERVDWRSLQGQPLILRASLPAERSSPVTIRLLRASPRGWDLVSEFHERTLEYVVTEPGAYRTEVWMNPKHLRRHLVGKGYLVKPMPWVYSNPIYVR
jgi:hypothetical protein